MCFDRYREPFPANCTRSALRFTHSAIVKPIANDALVGWPFPSDESKPYAHRCRTPTAIGLNLNSRKMDNPARLRVSG